MDQRPELLFIYGTLLTVSRHPLGELLRANGEFLHKGSMQARLFIITEIDAQGRNQYPAAIPSPIPTDLVHGEVWRVKNPEVVFPTFDKYEACSPDWPEPHEFLFRRVPVTLENGETVIAGAYLYAWDVSRARHVPGGRYETVSPDVR